MISTKEYAPYFSRYINPTLTNGKSMIENLIDSQQRFEDVLRNVPKEKHLFSYAEGKWTLKELIQHIIDTERIFCYRALCFSRNDATSLPGFDQDLFINEGNANERMYEALLDEMAVVRMATIHLFKSFSDEALERVGVGSGNNMSVRAAGIIISGHQNHHVQIAKERYLE
ncbi:DinB family protein [Flavobacteriaceae bacterium S356]|uniref:DinB family protein n=1 Tax=Asprobacillus argus TaxID=3076534 RepID=A0ABU3LF00_9FLAO|nr:DinB family protein [Flavobacteriaceae bacterium S356]